MNTYQIIFQVTLKMNTSMIKSVDMTGFLPLICSVQA